MRSSSTLTGFTGGPHLHFGVYLGGKTPVDPNPYYGAAVQIQPPKQADGTTPPPKIIPGGGKAITKTEVAARTGGSCEKVWKDYSLIEQLSIHDMFVAPRDDYTIIPVSVPEPVFKVQVQHLS